MTLDKRDLYRLPWSLNDNPIAWLEITDTCNLACDGCYRQHLTGHKPFERVQEEVDYFAQWRNPDNVSIAGGEPLLHPRILDIVALVRARGLKPIVLTNGVHLTPEMLRELRRAGAAGFTVHVDSHQGRAAWDGADEATLNAYRAEITSRVHAAGGMSLIFNATVYPDTVAQIPAVVDWARGEIGRVHGLVFITYRGFALAGTEARAVDGATADLKALGYSTEQLPENLVTGPQVVEWVRRAAPEYRVAGYLGGTVVHSSLKWMIGVQVGRPGRVYGSLGRRGMELAQAGHHMTTGRYLAYPASSRIGRRVLALAAWDRALRPAARAWWGDVVRHPSRLFDPLHVQSISVIQAPDLQGSGHADMCDSCPDMTVWKGELVNSCRMDEYRLFGGLVTVTEAAKPAGAEIEDDALVVS